MPTNFAPPVNVSPLIRFGRYSMLIAGISYGLFWQSRYTKKELGLKDFKAREKAARDERLAKEKAIQSAEKVFEESERYGKFTKTIVVERRREVMASQRRSMINDIMKRIRPK
ncbi:unnamed protein product [Nezara viridula]|uniref:ATP synthase F(0) complex subunit e, mitochondrial n=1 Tax=Nezara viridula TaxID=85310 RepID=A0A9P0MHG3_NEZVI|nr:unnamed protein product [Nezara viridula]